MRASRSRDSVGDVICYVPPAIRSIAIPATRYGRYPRRRLRDTSFAYLILSSCIHALLALPRRYSRRAISAPKLQLRALGGGEIRVSFATAGDASAIIIKNYHSRDCFGVQI